MTTHRYRCATTWAGSTAAGYEQYGRAHEVALDGVEDPLTVTADPAFLGDPALANPEQLLLAAASSCQLLSFLAVAARSRIDVVAYRDEAEAEMPDDDKPVRITHITLRPTITVAGELDEDRLAKLVDLAHRQCFIANSLNSAMTIEPRFERAS